MKKIFLHLISDSTGETLSSIAKAAFAQFDQIQIKEYIWSLVRTQGQLVKVISTVRKKPGIVMYTLTDSSLVELLREECSALHIPCMAVLDGIINSLSKILEINPNPKPGKQHVIDDEYFRKIEAMNYSIIHDDGQHVEDLGEAEVILVGPSRTSKTPTSMYLAHRGFKAANVPYVTGCPLPDILFKVKKPLIVGLAIMPSRLVELRKNRLISISDHQNTEYIDQEKVAGEMHEAKKIFVANRWPVIDITRKSVEEISATIVQLYQERKSALKKYD
jgi:regulator of PEP synthase PpsR (kinase-PPPase family)